MLLATSKVKDWLDPAHQPEIGAAQVGLDDGFGPLEQQDLLATGHQGTALAGAVGRQRRVVRLQAVQQHLAIRVFGQLQHVGVVGVEHRGALRQHHVDLGAHHVGHLLVVGDVQIGQARRAWHRHDHADLAAIIG